MIRAIIGTVSGDKVTFEQVPDRDAISKVIRQGGRRLWIDAVAPDRDERDWITQMTKLPPPLLDWETPLQKVYEAEQRIVLCLEQLTYSDGQWDKLPIIIQLKGDLLLTVRPRNTPLIDEALRTAPDSPNDWTDPKGLSPLLTRLIEAFIRRLEANLTPLRATQPNNQANHLISNYRHLLMALAHEHWIEQDEALALRLSALSERLDRLWMDLEDVWSGLGQQRSVEYVEQSTRLTRLAWEIRALLLVMLPLLTAALLSLALPIGDSSLARFGVMLIALYIIEGGIVSLAARR